MLKREFWEHQSIFLFVPAAISAFVVLLMVLSVFFVNMNISDGPDTIISVGDDHREYQHEDSNHDAKVIGSVRDIYTMKIQELAAADHEYRADQISKLLLGLAAPVKAVLMFVIFFYLLGSLYEERKNRSILFWKSMPVSDLSVICSKLASALVVAPVIALVCIAVTQIIALLMASVLAAIAGTEIWSVIWSPADLFSHWSRTTAFFMVQIFWSMPLFCWVVLVSAYARSIPLMWVFGIPLAVSIAEYILFSIDWFSSFVTRHSQPFGGLQMGASNVDTLLVADVLSSVDLWAGILIGIAFIAGAIWKRGRSEAI
jgi:ABC-2 type transport system permease protein